MKLMIDLLHIDDLYQIKNKNVDTIYISDGVYGIKQEASFTENDISLIRKITLDLGLQLFVDVNAIYHEDELPFLRNYLLFLKEIEVDGILFSDLAVYMMAKEMSFEHKLIYASETFVTNNFEANYWLERVASVVISNELSLEELIDIANQASKYVIYMAYGYHSMFYSKRELLTNYFVYKGKEKQNVINNRKFRIIEELRTEEYPIVQDERGTHIYTGKIFCMFQELDFFKQTNLYRLHLSANFLDKSQYYDVIRIYDEAIQAINNNTFNNIKSDLFQQLVIVNPNINTSHLYSKSILVKGRE